MRGESFDQSRQRFKVLNANHLMVTKCRNKEDVLETNGVDFQLFLEWVL